MGIIGGTLGYRILRYLSPGTTGNHDNSAYDGRSKLEVLFGPQIWDELRGKVVIDYGCECGTESTEMAQRGAVRVIGIDVREPPLADARAAAAKAGVSDRCVFTTNTDEKADVIVSLDAFEHFVDVAAELRNMRRLLNKGGYILTCFGPTWYHPLGGHGFAIFPWAHLVFTEKAILRWYREFANDDGATQFSKIRGGLNQMTIRRFEKTVAQSEFRFASFQAVPIRRLRRFANRFTREFTTAVVKARLVPRSERTTDS